ncbi:hypothetical protein V7S43_009452 [Phytophthora oleae]|uniref:Crinkler effector protein N-terminal domain-containing protein n=1 Tax=Phytophthora oleae TaxID=2107226 RepID=A0ABD3FGL7_9STRA
MVTLYCAVFGVAGSPFPVDVDPTLSVGYLKKAIKEKKKNDLKDVDADKLLLFLAEKNACGWLDEDEAAAVSFAANGHPEGVKLMEPSWFLANPEYFGATFQPGQGQIHVLVVVPVCGAKDDAGT